MVGERPGFVLPTPSSTEQTISQLHEVTLRFERTLEEAPELRPGT